MSFLANKLKLEVKSLNKSRLARFTSVQKDANIQIIPNDTSNYAAIIGASFTTNTTNTTSNIDAYIALLSDNINTKIISFDSNSINFGNDTLLKGNLIVVGTVYTVASDVLTEDNTFILNNYGTSSASGLNSISKKSLIYLYDETNNMSNLLTQHKLSEFNRLKLTLDIDSISALLNNNFTVDDFNELFSTKTLDDIAQGTSNKFIVDDQYNPTQNGHPLIVPGALFADDISTNDIYVNDIHAEYFYGDGTGIVNINMYLFNTNTIEETLNASNLYFTSYRMGELTNSSNLNLSNYAYDTHLSFTNFLDTHNIYTSNFINITSNTILSLLDYNRFIIYDLAQNTCNDILQLMNNSTFVQLNIMVSNSNNITNYLQQTTADISNIILENTNDVQQYLELNSSNIYSISQNINNIIYNDLFVFNEHSLDTITAFSNLSNDIIYTCNIDISNLIADVENIFIENMLSCNLNTSNNTFDIQNTLHSYINTTITSVSDYTSSQSNILIENTEISFTNVNTYLQQTIANISNYLYDNVQYVSNYIDFTSNLTAFQIMTENPIYIVDMNELMKFEFEEIAFLSDKSQNNVNLLNYGAVYSNIDDRNTASLSSGNYMRIQNIDWSVYSNLSISMWFNTDGLFDGNNLIDFTYLDIVTDQLKAWFNFENNFNDSINNYSLLPSVSSFPSFDINNKKIGIYSANFTDFSQFLQSADIDLSDKSFSISFWIYFNNATATSEWWIVSQGGVPALREVLHITLINETIKFGFWNDDLYTDVINLTELNNTWNHFVFVYNKEDNGSMKIYMNNILIASKNAGGLTSFAPNTFRIGKSINYGNSFIGNIDDFKIYYKALNVSEINKLYDINAQLKNIKIQHSNEMLQFIIDEQNIYSASYNANSWNYLLWNITSQTSNEFIKINSTKVSLEQLQLTSGSYVNTIGDIHTTGNIFISDFRALNIPLNDAIENELYNPTSTIDVVNNFEDINNVVNDTKIANMILYNSIKEYSNVSFINVINDIQQTSNDISANINRFATVQTNTKDDLVNTLNNDLNASVTNLTADIIPETIDNIYYTEDRFSNSFNTRTLDNIPVKSFGSNSAIVNNTYNSNLYIHGNLTAYNVSVFGDKARFNTTVYNTEIVKIDNYSNMPAMKLQNYMSTNADIINLANNSGSVFHLQNDGGLGIKKIPNEKLDVEGEVKAEYLFGSGKYLYNVNLNDRTTADLREGTSNLYFTNGRVSAVLIASNVLTSNYIRNESNILDVNIRNENNNISNLISNISNIIIGNNPYLLSSNYVKTTSNQIFDFILSSIINQSNYVLNMSNSVHSYIVNMYSDYNISDTIQLNSNFIHTSINYSNYILSNYLLDVSNLYEETYKNIQSTQSNYMRDTSDKFMLGINDLITNHSNLIFGFSNIITYYLINTSLIDTSNTISNNINNFVQNQSDYINNNSNKIIKYTSDEISKIQSSGGLTTYSYIYDCNLIHLNFRDKKVINNINSYDGFYEKYILTSNTSNFTNIYPVINNFTKSNNIDGYSSSNNWAFKSTSNIFIQVKYELSIAEIMNSLNLNIFSIHFAINIFNGVYTPIYYLGDNSKIYLSVKIYYNILHIIIGNTADESKSIFYVDSLILDNTWYIVDIICDGKSDINNINIDVYFNAIKQKVITTLLGTYNLAYIQSTTSNSMFIGSYDYNNIIIDNNTYIFGATYTNTYWSSNSLFSPNKLAPIIESSAYDYKSFSNLIYSSYYASNYEYQYSSNLYENEITNVNIVTHADERIEFNNMDFVLTELYANIKLDTGYYHFVLDLQNEVSAELLIGKNAEKKIDDYLNIANYYNSNLLNYPYANINHTSNQILQYPLFITTSTYYRFYLRTLRTNSNRNKSGLISKFYYTNTWNGDKYIFLEKKSSVNYIQASKINNFGYVGNLKTINNMLYINNQDILLNKNSQFLSSYNGITNYTYVCGKNTNGQLGIGNTTNSPSLKYVLTDQFIASNYPSTETQYKLDIINVNCSAEELFYVDKSGAVFGCGKNNYGQLGIGNTDIQVRLMQVKGVGGTGFITDIVQVTCGNNYSLFLKKYGTVYACGNNYYGNLGLGNTTDYTTLQQVKGVGGSNFVSNVVQVACGFGHSFFLKNDGTVYGCGYNFNGTLGLAINANQNTLQQVKGVGGVGFASNIVQVACGYIHSLFLKSDGTVYGCGTNSYNQLNLIHAVNWLALQAVLGVVSSNIVQVACGSYHSLFLKSNGTVYSCGRNLNGQLGWNNTTESSFEKQVLGVNGIGFVSNVVQVAAGYSHSLFLTSFGTVYSCGLNTNGELGLNNTTTQYTTLQQVKGINGLDFASNIKYISSGSTCYMSAFISSNVYLDSKPIYAYNYVIEDSFYSTGISSNNLQLQDFRIYTNNNSNDIINNISNVLYYGLNNANNTYTIDKNMQYVRWSESTDYTCNYYGLFNRFITYNDTGDIAVGIGKSTVPNATLDIYTYNPNLLSIKTNNPIWVNTAVLASSDNRIKTNFRDIYEDDALKQILEIQPKTYNYIDKNRTSENVIGFSAQQIKTVIPSAVSFQTEAIPNIQMNAYIREDYVYLENATNVLYEGVIVVIEFDNTKYYEHVTEISNDMIFKIENKSELPNNNTLVYVYGTIIDDFHSLDKNYVYTLSVCATQALHQKQEILKDNIITFIDELQQSPVISKYTSITSNIFNIRYKTEQMSSNIHDIYDVNNLLLNDLANIQNYIENFDKDLKELTTLNNIIISLEDHNSNLISKNTELFTNNSLYTNSIDNLDQNIKNINEILQKNNIV